MSAVSRGDEFDPSSYCYLRKSLGQATSPTFGPITLNKTRIVSKSSQKSSKAGQGGSSFYRPFSKNSKFVSPNQSLDLSLKMKISKPVIDRKYVKNMLRISKCVLNNEAKSQMKHKNSEPRKKSTPCTAN